jgi:hypothetical protein
MFSNESKALSIEHPDEYDYYNTYSFDRTVKDYRNVQELRREGWQIICVTPADSGLVWYLLSRPRDYEAPAGESEDDRD